MPESIKQILMRRDGVSSSTADEMIEAAMDDLQYYLSIDDQESAYNICQEHFGLEPDYLDELLW
jgi:hypothetical protein